MRRAVPRGKLSRSHPCLPRSHTLTEVEVGDVVRHRDYGVGRIVARDEAELTVAFRDETRTLSRPFKIIRLPGGGIDAEAFHDPELVGRLFHGDALGLALRIIRESPSGLDRTQLSRRLADLGVSGDDVAAWWADVEPRLRLVPELVSPDEPDGVWRLKSDDPPIQRESSAVLQDLIAKRLQPQKRKTLCQELQTAAVGGLASRSQLIASTFFGCAPDGVRPDEIATVDPSHLPNPVVKALLEKVGKDALPFVVKAALQGRETLAARDAAERALQLGSAAEVSLSVADHLAEAASELEEAGELQAVADTAARLRGSVQAARRLMTTGSLTYALLRSAILLHAATQAKRSEARETADLLRSIDDLLSEDQLLGSTLVQLFDSTEIAAVPDEMLAGVLASRPLEPESPRATYLWALVTAGRWRAAASERAWQGVSSAQLISLWGSPLLSNLLSRGPDGERGPRSVVSRAFVRDERSALSQLVAEPGMLRLCPPALLDRLVQRLSETDFELQQVLSLFVAPLVSAQLDQLRQEQAARDDDHARRMSAISSERDQLEIERDRLIERVAFLQSQLKHEAKVAQSATAPELRQSQIDGVRAAVDILAEAERWSFRHDEIAEALEVLIVMASRHGIRRLERPGAVVAFNPRTQRLVEGASAQVVSVVESGWALDVGEELLTLKHAIVRPSSGGAK